jgi:hypothetical protein
MSGALSPGRVVRAPPTVLMAGLGRTLALGCWCMTGGRVLKDISCAIADNSPVISNPPVMRNLQELFGVVALVPTARTPTSAVS